MVGYDIYYLRELRVCGTDVMQGSLFSYLSLEKLVPKKPTVALIVIIGRFHISLDVAAVFDARYLHTGRSSVVLEKLLWALLLQVLYTIRKERQLMEQLNYNLVFR